MVPYRPSRSWFYLQMACKIFPFLCLCRRYLLSQRLPYESMLCRPIEWSMEELNSVIRAFRDWL